MPTQDVEDAGKAGQLFVTTRWTVVLAAKNKSSADSAAALETLCRTYWYPLYALVRGYGYCVEDAQDLTQSFFARLLSKDYLRVVDPERGRFRTFLRMAIKRFLANEWDRLKAEKRGGGQVTISFDTTVAEQRFQGEQMSGAPPDVLYDRQWALTLLSEATSHLETEYESAGKAAELRLLKPHLTAERGQIPYSELASAMRTTEGAARVAVFRLRKRFRQLFREVIADTVSTPEETDLEIRHVLQVLGGM